MNALAFSWPIFIFGCVGAVAPEIVRLYRIRNDPAFNWSWFYLIISLLFAGLGGLVAWILPATTYWGAFYAGAAMPVIVSTILKSRKADFGDDLTALRDEIDELRAQVRAYAKGTDRAAEDLRETLPGQLESRIIVSAKPGMVNRVRDYMGALF